MPENQIEQVLKVYDNFSYYVNGKVDRGIEENRKGQFALAFTDEAGNPLENVKVSVKQISHEFNFGCNLFYLNHCATEELNEEYKAKFKKIFNYASIISIIYKIFLKLFFHLLDLLHLTKILILKNFLFSFLFFVF